MSTMRRSVAWPAAAMVALGFYAFVFTVAGLLWG
jgi:hypothetical protein